MASSWLDAAWHLPPDGSNLSFVLCGRACPQCGLVSPKHVVLSVCELVLQDGGCVVLCECQWVL